MATRPARSAGAPRDVRGVPRPGEAAAKPAVAAEDCSVSRKGAQARPLDPVLVEAGVSDGARAQTLACGPPRASYARMSPGPLCGRQRASTRRPPWSLPCRPPMAGSGWSTARCVNPSVRIECRSTKPAPPRPAERAGGSCCWWRWARCCSLAVLAGWVLGGGRHEPERAPAPAWLAPQSCSGCLTTWSRVAAGWRRVPPPSSRSAWDVGRLGRRGPARPWAPVVNENGRLVEFRRLAAQRAFGPASAAAPAALHQGRTARPARS